MNKDRLEKLRERNRDYVDQIKARPCTDCKMRFPLPAMDFDHVRGYKANTIASLVRRGVPLSRLKKELSKCELVCANCHRVRTAERAGWHSDPLAERQR